MNPEQYLTSDDYMSLMALVLNMPEDSGCQGILENLKFLKEENIKLKKKVEAEHSTGKKMYEAFMNERDKNKKLMEENTKLAKDYANIARPRRESPPRNIDGDVVLRLKRENDDLKKQIDEIASQNIEVARKNIENINQIKKLKENLKLSEDKVCELTHDLNKETERMSAADESMRFMGWVWDGEEWICQ